MLHQRRRFDDVAAILFDYSVSLQGVGETARILLAVLTVDDAHGQAAFVEILFESRANGRELVVRERVENLEEQRIGAAIAPRLIFGNALRIPVKRARMTTRIAQRLVDQSIAQLRLSRVLEFTDEHRKDFRLVVEKERFAVNLRPVGMLLAHIVERALAKLLVADSGDDARRHRSGEQRRRIDGRRVRARKRLKRGENLPRGCGIGACEFPRFGGECR